MPANAYVLLAVSGGVLRGVIALWLIGASVRAVRKRRADPNTSESAEALVASLVLLVLALTLCSGPLEYLVLRRWQTELPGAMCLYGVINFGHGQPGLAGWLPVLFETAAGLQAAVFLLVSSWAICLLIERQSRIQTTRSPSLILALFLGAASLAAATTETVFLSAPRKFSTSNTGCCVIETASRAQEAPVALSPAQKEKSWSLFLSVNCALLVLLFAGGPLLHAKRADRRNGAAAVILVMGVVSAVVSIPFARDVLAPELLGLPYHRCLYDLVLRMPEMLIAFALYYVALIALGSSALVGRLYRMPLEGAAAGSVANAIGITAHALLSSLVIVCMAAALEWK